MKHGSGGQLTIWLSFSIVLLSAGLVCHVLSIPAILDAAGRDGWLSVLFASPFFLLFLAMVFVIIRRLRGQRLTDWIERQFGAVPAWIFRISAAAVLLALGTHTLYETSNWSITTYLQFTPISVVVLSGALVSALAAYRGIRTIAMTSSILLPFVILLGYFVMSANMKYKDYSQLLPIMEYGVAPVMRGMIYSLAGLAEMWILMLYQHELRTRIRWWQLLLLGLFMIGMTVGPTMAAIAEFGPEEATKQQNSPFEQWRLVNIGKLMQHVDFLSIYQWLSGSFARIAISMYLVVDLLNFRHPRRRLIAIGCVTAVMSAVSMYWWRVDLVYNYVNGIQFPSMLAYVFGVTTLLTFAAMIRRKDKEAIRNGEPNREERQEG